MWGSGKKGRIWGLSGITLVIFALVTMVIAPFTSAATFTTWSVPYYGQGSYQDPCDGSVTWNATANPTTGLESVGVWDLNDANVICELFGSNSSSENADAGLHGEYWGVSGSSSNNYNFYFDYSLTITAFLGGNCVSDTNSVERLWFLSDLWDTDTGTNIYGPAAYAPSALTGGACSSNNACDTTFTSNVTVSLPGGSTYQPRVATDAGVYIGNGDYLVTNSASADANSGQYNSDCGRDNGVTLNSMSMYGWPGGGVSVTDPGNSTRG